MLISIEVWQLSLSNYTMYHVHYTGKVDDDKSLPDSYTSSFKFCSQLLSTRITFFYQSTSGVS